MSKAKLIQQFASQYQNFNFKQQMYAMSVIANTLGVHMFFYANVVNGKSEHLETSYQFQTFGGRNIIKITLKNAE